MLSEEDLIQVYRDTLRPLYAYVSRRVGGDTGLAEDIVQETWMRALDNWPARGTPDNPVAWLMLVARNTLISHFRRQRPDSIDPALLEVEDKRFSPEAPDSALVVGWGLSQLGRPQAEVLEAFYFEGQSVRDIAAAQGTSERAVEGRLRRARAQLRTKLSRLVRRNDDA